MTVIQHLHGVFRALMSRAVFTCSSEEFFKAKETLIARGNSDDTNKEKMKLAG